jgi:transposase
MAEDEVMRGRVNAQGAMFYAIDLEALVPLDHPLRAIRKRADAELIRLRPGFNAAYSAMGRPSVPPEQLIKACLLQALYSIRSHRALCEQISYNLLFRWFLGMTPEDAPWDHSTFTKNQERFAEHGLMEKFFSGTVARAIAQEYASSEHLSVDGTLIQAWGSMKSFRPRDEEPPQDGPADSNRWVNWHGEKRSNATHESKTDPEARLSRKSDGQGSILAHSLHALMENRSGLLLEMEVEEANGRAEREAARVMLARLRKRHALHPKTLGADKGYDDGAFLRALEKQAIVPHVAVREQTLLAQDESGQARRRMRRRQRNVGYKISQKARRKIEEIFGWLKSIAGLRKARFAGRWKIKLYALAAGAAYNLLRLARLEAAA